MESFEKQTLVTQEIDFLMTQFRSLDVVALQETKLTGKNKYYGFSEGRSYESDNCDKDGILQNRGGVLTHTYGD
jgi:hypothetical protein